MSRRPDPLVPLSLFRIHRFAVINLATFLIYGALYVFLAYQAIFLQGTLGYTATAAAVAALPAGILLTVLSTRVGSLAGRYGPRRFLVAGPLLMAAGLAWYARVPATSEAWQFDLSAPASYVPPVSTLVDILPAMIVYGIGISLVVAPLTSTLMTSIPVARAGLGSAINNSISRIGYPLIGAIVFIAITASFYANLAAAIPGLDPSEPAAPGDGLAAQPGAGRLPPGARRCGPRGLGRRLPAGDARRGRAARRRGGRRLRRAPRDGARDRPRTRDRGRARYDRDDGRGWLPGRGRGRAGGMR